jgi:hypothetical protein
MKNMNKNKWIIQGFSKDTKPSNTVRIKAQDKLRNQIVTATFSF